MCDPFNPDNFPDYGKPVKFDSKKEDSVWYFGIEYKNTGEFLRALDEFEERSRKTTLIIS
jgi:hypothetical protein